MAVHATFQRFSGPGKKARLREFGFWHMDPPQYYGQLDEGEEGPALGRLAASNQFKLKALAYDGQREVLAFVEGEERRQYGGKQYGMPPFEKHWLGMSYQLAAFRHVVSCTVLSCDAVSYCVVLPGLLLCTACHYEPAVAVDSAMLPVHHPHTMAPLVLALACDQRVVLVGLGFRSFRLHLRPSRVPVLPGAVPAT
jgi:hypothetical protein